MVVLAASICTKAGKAVLSRQFVEMSRSRIEGLIASFPKLIGVSDQHTYIETDAVRYVYQPLDNLFMVLVTTKNSNILQDIDTLHLFARLVSEYCRSNDEREIAKHAFDLLLVFDEVISLGYRENINLGQIRTISAMESHEERVQAEIEKNKEKEAAEELKRKAKMMDTQRRDAAKKGYGGSSGGFGGFGSGKRGSGMGSGGSGNMTGISSGFSNSSNQGGSNQGPSNNYSPSSSSANNFGQGSAQSMPASAPVSGRGMQLGGSQRQNSVLESITAYEGIKTPSNSTTATGGSTQATVRPAVHEEGVHVVVEEKVSVAISRDGGLQSFEVNGSMMLKINSPSSARVKLEIVHNSDPNLRFTTHPNVDKGLWASDSVIALRDPSRPFPVGQALGILRWKVSSRDETLAPLLINCWPSPTGNGACDVNIEYELQNLGLELHDVLISIPYPGSNAPTIGDVEGHYTINRQNRVIQWSLPLIDASNSSGVLEFNVSSEDVNAFYPIEIVFTSFKLLNPIHISNVNTVEGDAATFSIENLLRSDVYQVV
ncbi:hypothetical protein BDV3_007177 [Batrachochytrium dendrobatidis]|nr:coatomer subunit delta [Batrachochytrium dendrobatidis]KAK5667433.1 coatomer subunit delta [Batrachochytrium dendrobatidis]